MAKSSQPYLWAIYLMICLPFYIINPTIGIILSTLIIFKSEHKCRLLPIYVFLLSIWISLVNLTKMPTSDQVMYMRHFVRAGELDFNNWWREATGGNLKEPLFYLYTYIAHYCFLGQVKIYLFSLSFINYIILLNAVVYLNAKLKVGFLYSFSGIIICLFFPMYFVLTLHVVRQVIATTLVVAAILLRGIDRQHHYWLLVCAVLIHTSLVFLSGLALIPWFYNRLKLWQIMICAVLISGFIIMFGTIGKVLLANSTTEMTTYAFSRMRDNAADATGEVALLPKLIVLCPMCIISLKLILIDLPRGRYTMDSTLSTVSPLYPIVYIFLLLGSFVLGMMNAPLMQYRFFMMTLTFMPFIYPYMFYKNIISKIYHLAIIIVVPLVFLIHHNKGEFKYASLDELLCYSIFQYL